MSPWISRVLSGAAATLVAVTAAHATAKAQGMPGASAPAASRSGRSVTLAWSASSFSPGGAVAGYTVTRYPAAGGAGQAAATGCDTVVTALTRTIQAASPGSWKYAVTPVQANWVGSESAQSATVVVPAPALMITSSTTVASLPATVSVSLSGFIAGATLSYRLDDPSTGTPLSATTTPSTIPANGQATATITLPAGTSGGPHTIYAVSSSADVAIAALTVTPCTPGSVTVNPDADTSVWEDRSSTEATSTTVTVRSDNPNNKVRRVLVHFGLPALPGICAFTGATLRLYTTSGSTGRTIDAYGAVGSWTETGVTWATQPTTSGAPAQAASVASGWLSWTVTSMVQSMYAGANDGFSIRDDQELNGVVLQTFATREAATNKPELVITYG